MGRITETVKEKPEKYKNVAEIRLKPEELNRLLGLFAINEEIVKACQDERIMARIRQLPNGLRDIRMIASVMAKITDGIVWTIPREKVPGFARAMSRAKYVVMQGPLAAKPKTNEEEIITTRELDELVYAAGDGRCRMCLDGNCSRCELGRVLDGVVGVDRAGRSWSVTEIRTERSQHHDL